MNKVCPAGHAGGAGAAMTWVDEAREERARAKDKAEAETKAAQEVAGVNMVHRVKREVEPLLPPGVTVLSWRWQAEPAQSRGSRPEYRATGFLTLALGDGVIGELAAAFDAHGRLTLKMYRPSSTYGGEFIHLDRFTQDLLDWYEAELARLATEAELAAREDVEARWRATREDFEARWRAVQAARGMSPVGRPFVGAAADDPADVE